MLLLLTHGSYKHSTHCNGGLYPQVHLYDEHGYETHAQITFWEHSKNTQLWRIAAVFHKDWWRNKTRFGLVKSLCQSHRVKYCRSLPKYFLAFMIWCVHNLYLRNIFTIFHPRGLPYWALHCGTIINYVKCFLRPRRKLSFMADKVFPKYAENMGHV